MGEDDTELTLIGEDGSLPPEVAIASSSIPYSRDDNKGRYLSFRACGLSVLESLNAVGVTQAALDKWRRIDLVFKDLETRVPEFRAKVAAEFITAEHLRNMLLLMKRDHNVIQKALDVDAGIKIKGEMPFLTREEADYLKKIRGMYTPEQLETLQSLFKRSSDDKFDWAKAVESRARGKNVKLTETRTVEIGSGETETDN